MFSLSLLMDQHILTSTLTASDSGQISPYTTEGPVLVLAAVWLVVDTSQVEFVV